MAGIAPVMKTMDRRGGWASHVGVSLGNVLIVIYLRRKRAGYIPHAPLTIIIALLPFTRE